MAERAVRRTTVTTGGLILLAAVTLLSGCETISEFIDQTGIIDDGTREAFQNASSGLQSFADSIDSARSPFTPEQEYYIGRSVAAQILRDYEPYGNPFVNIYVNQVGQSLALVSERPVLYHGYTFLVLDTDEINAFATPGGHIFITLGLMRLTENEAELAAVLGHEIGHVVERHGLGSIRTARVLGAVQDGVFQVVDAASPEELSEVTGLFTDTTGDMVDALVTRGYSGATERQADGISVELLNAVGYDPYAIIRVLERMDEVQRAEYEGTLEPRGFSKTHPRPQLRINDLLRTELSEVPEGGRIDENAAQRRYDSALRNL